MAGFLTTPLSFNETFANTSSTLLRFGEQCFDVLAWTVVAAIGRRNVYGCLVSAGVMHVMSSIGTLIGAMSGHITNDFVHTDFFMATGFALTMVFAFFAFLWCGFRSFSFTDAIESVTTVSHPSSDEQVDGESDADAGKTAGAMPNASGEEPAVLGQDASPALSADGTATAGNAFAANAAAGDIPASDGASVMDAVRAAGTAPSENGPAPEAGAATPEPNQLHENCARLGDEFGLTAREREVFVLLAHGRNGRYIMDHLVISRNTAKSHIKHIYSKLGVHSHQELIDLATQGQSL